MSESVSDLEREIEASRARLDQTIGRIQERLTPGNLVGEVFGAASATPVNGLYDSALGLIRRNPLPVLLIAAGVGLLLNRMSEESRPRALRPLARGRVPERTSLDPADATVSAIEPDVGAGALPSERIGASR